MRLISAREAQAATRKSNSQWYLEISQGTIPEGVRIGKNSVAWPEHEINAINQARVAGYTDEKIKELVRALVEKRKAIDPLASIVAGEVHHG